MYFAGTVQADYLVGQIYGSIDASDVTSDGTSTLGTDLVNRSLPIFLGSGATFTTASSVTSTITATSGGMRKFPNAGTTDGQVDYYYLQLEQKTINQDNGGGNELTAFQNPKWRTRDEMISDLGAVSANATATTLTGNLTVQGSTTLGDAAGDTLTVSGPITAAGATGTTTNNVANVGTLDSRYKAIVSRRTSSTPISNNSTLTNLSPTIELAANTTYRVQLYYTTYVNSGTMGVRARLNYTGSVEWSVPIATMRALNGSNWVWTPGGSIFQTINATADFTQMNASLYGWSYTGIFKTTTAGTFSIQAAQVVAEAAVLDFNCPILIVEPIAY
jgi:hypothetical protein